MLWLSRKQTLTNSFSRSTKRCCLVNNLLQNAFCKQYILMVKD